MSTRKKKATRRTRDALRRIPILQGGFDTPESGGVTTFAASLMFPSPYGSPAECTITAHCHTAIFEFPGSRAVAGGHVDSQIVYSMNGFRAAIVSDLPSYFEKEPAKSRHHGIDVSLRAGVRSTHAKAVERYNKMNPPAVPLFLVIERYQRVPVTALNNGECFTVDEYRDGTPVVEGGRQGERALVAVRTIDGSWPDFHPDTRSVNMVLAAVKAEQDFTGHIEELYSCSCFVSDDEQAVYPLVPRTGMADGSVSSRVEPLILRAKAGRIQTMIDEMAAESGPIAEELLESIMLDKTKDDNYLRLWYLRLWEALVGAGQMLGYPQIDNYDHVVAGDSSPKRLTEYRIEIAHWYTSKIDHSLLSDLQKTALELLRRRFGSTTSNRSSA